MVLAVLVWAAGRPIAAGAPTAVLAGFVRGVVLAKPKPGVSASRLAATVAGQLAPATLTRLGIVKLRVRAGAEVAFAEQLSRSGLVDFASPDYLRHLAVTPNDPLYDSQWALPKIEAPLAWQTTTGSTNVTVAVIDTGYDLSHPDRPVNLIAGPTYVSAPDPSCPPEGVNGPQDDQGHGTHVGGIVAAAFDDGIGVAGLAPGVTVLIVKAADCTGNLADSDVATAITYATDAGARVINMSFGGPTYSDVLNQGVQYAWSRGVVLVAAAGNQGSSAPFYPAWLPNVMAVSATDQNDAIAWFSNVGPDIAVAAPGVDVLSTYPGGYQSLSGTSMAAPHVSAVAGLILSADGSFRNDQVVAAIERGAIGMGPGCPNQTYGYGRLDAAAALGQAQLMDATRSASVEQSLPFQIYLPLVRNRSCG